MRAAITVEASDVEPGHMIVTMCDGKQTMHVKLGVDAASQLVEAIASAAATITADITASLGMQIPDHTLVAPDPDQNGE